MANYSERRRRRHIGGKTAIVAGIIVALIGIYFIVGISSSTDRKNAECTEETTGTVISSEPSKSGYRTTVEYTPGYSPMTTTFNTKKQYEAGSEVPVKYHPTSFTRVYIEGMSETGREDVKTGGIFILLGVVLSTLGVFTDKMRASRHLR